MLACHRSSPVHHREMDTRRAQRTDTTQTQGGGSDDFLAAPAKAFMAQQSRGSPPDLTFSSTAKGSRGRSKNVSRGYGAFTGGRSLQTRLLKEKEEEIRARKQNVIAHGPSRAEVAQLEKNQVTRMLDLSKSYRFRSRNSQILQNNGQLVTVQGVLWPREQSVGLDVRPPHFPGCTCEQCEGVIERVVFENQDKAAHERSVAAEFARLQVKHKRTAAAAKTKALNGEAKPTSQGEKRK